MGIKQNSIKVNFIFNVLLNVCGTIFPLVTFPYVSRVLNPEGIGRVNYANSIVSYLALLAGLGINTYGLKEGAHYRDDKEKLGKFVSEMLIINSAAIMVSYVILAFILLIPDFRGDIKLLLIYGTTIFVAPFSINWFISLMEEYRYTTIRTLIFQFVGMILIFALVKNQEHLIRYALINAATGMMTMLVNLHFSGRYIKLFRYKGYSLRKHLKPIVLIFGSTVSATIYLNSDITILGYMRGDYAAGIYSSAVKIIKIIITFATSLTTVLMPRIVYYISNHYDIEYRTLLKRGADFLLMMTIPACIGIFLISDEVVNVILGKQYWEAVLTMRILAFDIILSPLGGFISYQIVLPHNKERVFFCSTLISCVLNIVLNIIMIPKYAQNAAAFTTLLAEAVNIIICYLATRRDVRYVKCLKSVRDYLAAAVVMVPVIFVVQHMLPIPIVCLIAEIILAAAVYGGILLTLKNEMAMYLWKSLLGRLKKIGL